MGVDDFGARLERLGLSWPLHTVEIDEERNSEAHWSEPQELNVVFDDVSGYEFEQEIDALAARLGLLLKVRAADREDREFIVVELWPGLRAAVVRNSIDRTVRRFMRRAICRRTAPC